MHVSVSSSFHHARIVEDIYNQAGREDAKFCKELNFVLEDYASERESIWQYIMSARICNAIDRYYRDAPASPNQMTVEELVQEALDFINTQADEIAAAEEAKKEIAYDILCMEYAEYEDKTYFKKCLSSWARYDISEKRLFDAHHCPKSRRKGNRA